VRQRSAPTTHYAGAIEESRVAGRALKAGKNETTAVLGGSGSQPRQRILDRRNTVIVSLCRSPALIRIRPMRQVLIRPWWGPVRVCAPTRCSLRACRSGDVALPFIGQRRHTLGVVGGHGPSRSSARPRGYGQRQRSAESFSAPPAGYLAASTLRMLERAERSLCADRPLPPPAVHVDTRRG